MSFTLGVIEPPQGEAKYGKAAVIPSLPDRMTVRNITFDKLWTADPNAPATPDEGPWEHDAQAWKFAEQFMSAESGTELTDPRTGLHFRIDKAEDAPHPCSCCGRLVLPADHAYAHDPDAYCTGCYTWDRNVAACLPENTAHAVKGE